MILEDFVMADHQGVSRALTITQEFAKKADAPQAVRVRLLLVIEELLVNVIKHGRPPAGSRIEFGLTLMEDRIEIRQMDAGAPFDPRTDIPTLSREDAVLGGIEGGVGWPMILQWCEFIAYERTGDRNKLVLALDFPR
jgi:anti-sigma regulatory factor (Ser/Thr protein kinase)